MHSLPLPDSPLPRRPPYIPLFANPLTIDELLSKHNLSLALSPSLSLPRSPSHHHPQPVYSKILSAPLCHEYMYVSSRGSSHNLKKASPLHRSNPYQRTHPLAHTHTYLRAIAGVRKRRRALALLTFRLLAGAKLDARARALARGERASELVGIYLYLY